MKNYYDLLINTKNITIKKSILLSVYTVLKFNFHKQSLNEFQDVLQQFVNDTFTQNSTMSNDVIQILNNSEKIYQAMQSCTKKSYGIIKSETIEDIQANCDAKNFL